MCRAALQMTVQPGIFQLTSTEHYGEWGLDMLCIPLKEL
jgi:hypothetical protein